MTEGDGVCVLFDGRVPSVLGRLPDNHLFIGETHLHDEAIMQGKLTEGVRFRDQLPTVTFDVR